MKLRSAAGRVRSGVLQLMVLLALATGLPGDATVLCIGPGGHLAFEPAPVGGPTASVPDRCGTDGAPAAAGCGCQDPCGPCHDIRLGPGFAAVRLSRQPEPDLRATLAWAPHASLAPAPALPARSADVPLALPPHLSPHLKQSVVLLI